MWQPCTLIRLALATGARRSATVRVTEAERRGEEAYKMHNFHHHPNLRQRPWWRVDSSRALFARPLGNEHATPRLSVSNVNPKRERVSAAAVLVRAHHEKCLQPRSTRLLSSGRSILSSSGTTRLVNLYNRSGKVRDLTDSGTEEKKEHGEKTTYHISILLRC